MWGRRRRWEGCEVCCGEAGGLAPNPSGCPCCSPPPEEKEEGKVSFSRIVTARAPRSPAGIERRRRNGILPGDRIEVTTGFYYIPGGERLRYFRVEYPVRKG
jgi:hypothetical protein